VQRKKPLWIAAAYDIQANDALDVGGQPIGTFVELMELVSWQDYTDETGLPGNRKETCGVQRVLGQCAVDLVASTQQSNAVFWAAAVIVMSSEALENVFTADPADLVLHDAATFEENITRLNVMQWSPTAGYNAVFEVLPQAAGTSFAPATLGPQAANGRALEWNFDLNVKRKLHTDESVWMLVTGLVIKTVAEFGLGTFIRTETRSVIYDD